MAVQPGWRGRALEDSEVGDVYKHPLGRTISQADNSWSTLLAILCTPMCSGSCR